MLLEPKPHPVTTQSGASKTFILSKFPAIQGREIMMKYPTSNVPKLGDYAMSEATMLQLMTYVGVEIAPGNVLPLSTQELVNNHVGDWETLLRIEFEMIRYNTSFFKNGLNFDFFASISPKVEALISRISTDLLPQLLRATEQRSTNSEPSTPLKTRGTSGK